MRPKFVFLSLLLASGTAFADDPKFVFGKPEELKDVKGVEWTATGEAGLVFTTGNSETTTITGGFHVTRKEGDNKISMEGGIAYADSVVRSLADKNGNGLIDGADELVSVDTTTAETEFAKLRYDRFLTKFNSLYIAALGLRDVPAGKAYVFGGQAGYSRRLAKTDTSETVAEIGYDFSHEQSVSPPGMDVAALEIHSLRGFIGTKIKMTPGTDVEASGELLTNLSTETLNTGQSGGIFEDTRFNGKVIISAKIGKNLAATTSIEIHYDHRPAALPLKNLAPGVVIPAAPMDTLMKVGVIYTFF